MKASACLALAVLPLCATALAGNPPVQPVFHPGNFHAPLVIDNPWSPAQAGTRTVNYELEDGACHVNDVVVTHDAKRDFRGDYAGLAARAVRDRVWADPGCDGHRGLLLEDTTDWIGQDDAGNVWYFGEATVEYTYDRAGHRIDASREGSWEAGRRGAKAGILMFAHPVVGMYYLQEFESGVAEDAALVKRVDASIATGLGRFNGCIETRETTALSPGDVEYKYYCRNLGVVRVVSPNVHGGAELVDFGVH